MNGYALDDQCFGNNVTRAEQNFSRLSADWSGTTTNSDWASSILSSIRDSTPDEACADVAARLVKGKADAGATWDAVHLAAAELKIRTQGAAAIAGIHAVTACNALHYSYLSASEPKLRLLILLQAVGWMGQFRTWSETREDNLRKLSITSLEPAEESDSLENALATIFSEAPSKPDASAARVLVLARNQSARQAFLNTAVRFTLAKADEVHYYKYLAALIEDIPLVSPEWRPHLLATSVYYIKGSNDPEPAWTKSAREALTGLAQPIA